MTVASVNDEAALRPDTWNAIVGQAGAVDALRTATDAALERGDMPGHTLLMGPPGTGKTTFAVAMAKELGADLRMMFGPNLRSDKDLMEVVSKMSASAAGKWSGRAGSKRWTGKRYVLMVDEIHRMYGPVQESLYTVMEDGRLLFGDGSFLPLAPLTVVGATTDPDRLLEPMLTRFPIKVRLTLYSDADLATIATRAATTLGYNLTTGAALAIASHSHGTPRIAISIVRVLRDYAKPDPVTEGMQGKGDDWIRGRPWASISDVLTLMAQPALVWDVNGRDASGRRGERGGATA